MPVCLRAPPVRTPDPPHPARLPTQPPLCARPSRNRNLSARISNIFFFSAPNHLAPANPDFQQTCARAPRHTGVYVEGHKNASYRLRPRPDQTHQGRQGRHASSLLRARPALLSGPLVVPPTPHRRGPRRSSYPSPRPSPRPTCAAASCAHASTRARAPTHSTPIRGKPARRQSVPPERANQFEPTHECNCPLSRATGD